MKKNLFRLLMLFISVVACLFVGVGCNQDDNIDKRLVGLSVELVGSEYLLLDGKITTVYQENKKVELTASSFEVTAIFDDDTSEVLDLSSEIEFTSTIPELDTTPAGNYTVSFKHSELKEKFEISVVVEKATINIGNLVWSGAEFTFNGNEHIVEITNLPDGVNVVYEGNSATNCDEGGYVATARLSVEDFENYNEISEQTITHNWKINKKIISVPEANLKSYIYDTKIHSAEVINLETDFTSKDIRVEFVNQEIEDVKENSNAGTYWVTLNYFYEGDDEENYILSKNSERLQWKIEKAPYKVSAKLVDGQNLVYNGTPQTIKIDTSDINDAIVKVKEINGATETDAGSVYNAEVVFELVNNNYYISNLDNCKMSFNWSISKRPVVVCLKDCKIPFGSPAQNDGYECNDVVGGDEILFSNLKFNYFYNKESSSYKAGDEIGEYIISAELVSDEPSNYKIKIQNGVMEVVPALIDSKMAEWNGIETIVKAENNKQIEWDTTIEYIGKEISLELTFNYGLRENVKFQYSYNGSDWYDSITVKEKRNYTIYAKIISNSQDVSDFDDYYLNADVKFILNAKVEDNPFLKLEVNGKNVEFSEFSTMDFAIDDVVCFVLKDNYSIYRNGREFANNSIEFGDFDSVNFKIFNNKIEEVTYDRLISVYIIDSLEINGGVYSYKNWDGLQLEDTANLEIVIPKKYLEKYENFKCGLDSATYNDNGSITISSDAGLSELTISFSRKETGEEFSISLSFVQLAKINLVTYEVLSIKTGETEVIEIDNFKTLQANQIISKVMVDTAEGLSYIIFVDENKSLELNLTDLNMKIDKLYIVVYNANNEIVDSVSYDFAVSYNLITDQVDGNDYSGKSLTFFDSVQFKGEGNYSLPFTSSCSEIVISSTLNGSTTLALKEGEVIDAKYVLSIKFNDVTYLYNSEIIFVNSINLEEVADLGIIIIDIVAGNQLLENSVSWSESDLEDYKTNLVVKNKNYNVEESLVKIGNVNFIKIVLTDKNDKDDKMIIWIEVLLEE